MEFPKKVWRFDIHKYGIRIGFQAEASLGHFDIGDRFCYWYPHGNVSRVKIWRVI